jgi:hypothetical protein
MKFRTGCLQYMYIDHALRYHTRPASTLSLDLYLLLLWYYIRLYKHTVQFVQYSKTVLASTEGEQLVNSSHRHEVMVEVMSWSN